MLKIIPVATIKILFALGDCDEEENEADKDTFAKAVFTPPLSCWQEADQFIIRTLAALPIEMRQDTGSYHIDVVIAWDDDVEMESIVSVDPSSGGWFEGALAHAVREGELSFVDELEESESDDFDPEELREFLRTHEVG